MRKKCPRRYEQCLRSISVWFYTFLSLFYQPLWLRRLAFHRFIDLHGGWHLGYSPRKRRSSKFSASHAHCVHCTAWTVLSSFLRPYENGKNPWARRGYFRQNLYVDVPNRPGKLDFLPIFHTITHPSSAYHFRKRHHPILLKMGAFTRSKTPNLCNLPG